MPLSTQCPQCGFDLEPGTPCRVCGYVPDGVHGDGDGAGRVPPKNTARRDGSPFPPSRATKGKGRRGSLGAIISASVGLLVVLAAFLGVDLWWHSGPGKAPDTELATGTEPQEAQAPETAPAPLPAPAPATIVSPARSAADAAAKAAPARAPVPAPSRAPLAVMDEAAPDAVEHQLADSGPGFDIATRHDDPPTTSADAFVSWMRAHTDQKEKFLLQKWTLTQGILRSRTITHRRVLGAFLRTPREYFCRDTRRAYEDAVLPIGYGQTISGPYMVARMTDWLNPAPEQKVLEIGTGSGYQSAVLSELSNYVYTVEIVDPLARETDAIYRKHEARYPELRNIQRKIDDGYYGWKEHAPYDRIIVTCGIDHVPPELLSQLAPGGMMVIPVGPPSGQTILRITKRVDADGTVRLDREDIFQGKRREIFVPFTARGGRAHVENGGTR